MLGRRTGSINNIVGGLNDDLLKLSRFVILATRFMGLKTNFIAEYIISRIAPILFNRAKNVALSLGVVYSNHTPVTVCDQLQYVIIKMPVTIAKCRVHSQVIRHTTYTVCTQFRTKMYFENSCRR